MKTAEERRERKYLLAERTWLRALRTYLVETTPEERTHLTDDPALVGFHRARERELEQVMAQ